MADKTTPAPFSVKEGVLYETQSDGLVPIASFLHFSETMVEASQSAQTIADHMNNYAQALEVLSQINLEQSSAEQSQAIKKILENASSIAVKSTVEPQATLVF